MKHYQPLIVFLLLALSAAVTSFGSYSHTRLMVETDLQQALEQTMREQPHDVLTTDTIRVFNSHLLMAELRGRAVLTVDTRQRAFCIEAHCPASTVLGLSDQRPAAALASMALFWVAGCSIRKRRRPLPQPQSFGGLAYDEAKDRFYNAQLEEVGFTPMQHRLMVMFFTSPDHRIDKSEICDALWPKKDDASETLYSLIRRLKPVLEAHTSLSIEAERSRSYRLISNELA